MVLREEERNDIYLSIASLSLAAFVFCGGTLFEDRRFHKIFLSSSASILSLTGLILSNTKGEEARRYSKLAINSQWEKALIISEHSLEDIYRKLHPRGREIIEAEYTENPKELAPAEEGNPFYDWNDIAEESSGIIIAGPTGYGKSTVAIAILGMLTKDAPAIIKVYDPHANRNRWHDFGLESISNFEEIEESVINLEKELDKRRKQSDNGEQIIVVIDELGACYDNFKDAKNISRIIKRFLSEGRKYGICVILLNQSDNCSAIGIDSKYRDNAFLIALGSLARKMFKKGTSELALLESVAYPAAVGGCVECQIAIHPTHGHHEKFKKKGNPPKGLSSINQIDGRELAIETRKMNVATSEKPEIDLESLITGNSDLPASILSPSEWEFFAFIQRKGSISVTEAKHTSVVWKNKWEVKKIKEIFSKFGELGLGEMSGNTFYVEGKDV